MKTQSANSLVDIITQPTMRIYQLQDLKLSGLPGSSFWGLRHGPAANYKATKIFCQPQNKYVL